MMKIIYVLGEPMEKSQGEIRFKRTEGQKRPYGIGVQKFDDYLWGIQGPKRIHERNVGFSLWYVYDFEMEIFFSNIIHEYSYSHNFDVVVRTQTHSAYVFFTNTISGLQRFF